MGRPTEVNRPMASETAAGTAKAGFGAAVAYASLLVALDLAFVIMAIQVPAADWEGMAAYARSYQGIAFLPQAIGLASLPALVVMLAAVHITAAQSRKPWSLAALSFGSAHVVLLGSLYFIQVAILLPALKNGRWGGLDQFAFANPRSVAWGLNHFAWALLGIALLLLVPVFEGGRRRRSIRWLLVLNGVANISLILAFAFDFTPLTLTVAVASWVVALPAAALLIALAFRDIVVGASP